MGKALITGSSAGIGEVFARRLAQRGEDLVLIARREDRLVALRDDLRARHAVSVEIMVADLGDPAQLQSVAARTGEGDITLLINNAGINGYGQFADVDPGVLEAVLDLNATAPLMLTRAAVPAMLQAGGGAIINVASLLAFSGASPPNPMPARATYGATKAFLVTFSRILAAELADTSVRVQVLCPGYTATEFHMSNGTAPVQGTAPAEQPRAMSAEDVVQASLTALEDGEVVCIPGLDDPAVVDRLVDVEAALRAGSRREIAARYVPA